MATAKNSKITEPCKVKARSFLISQIVSMGARKKTNWWTIIDSRLRVSLKLV